MLKSLLGILVCSLAVMAQPRGTLATPPNPHPTPATGDTIKRFAPLRFVRGRTIHVEISPERLFALFDAEGIRAKLSSDYPHRMQVLSPGRDASLAGTITRSTDTFIYTVITERDPDRNVVRYLEAYGNVEVIVMDVRCAPSPQGGTDLTIEYRCIGTSEAGNALWQPSLVAEGGLAYERSIDSMLPKLDALLKHGPGARPETHATSDRPPHDADAPASEPDNGGAKRFEPTPIERSRSIRFEAAPDEVYALFEPQQSMRWIARERELRIVFAGSDDSHFGAMYRTNGEREHEVSWWLVGEHDPRARFIRNAFLIPDAELGADPTPDDEMDLSFVLLVEEIRCTPEARGGTMVEGRWRYVGNSARAHERARSHFGGGLDRQIDLWRSRLGEATGRQ